MHVYEGTYVHVYTCTEYMYGVYTLVLVTRVYVHVLVMYCGLAHAHPYCER